MPHRCTCVRGSDRIGTNDPPPPSRDVETEIRPRHGQDPRVRCLIIGAHSTGPGNVRGHGRPFSSNPLGAMSSVRRVGVHRAAPLPARLPLADRLERGRTARTVLSRSELASGAPEPGTRDAVTIISDGDETRIADLVPHRYGQLSMSPFASFCGSPVVMAFDLARRTTTGLVVQLHGNAHLGNFRLLNNDDGGAVFGLVGFDETLPGPFEWDLHRLAVSVELAGRGAGIDERDRSAMVRRMVACYRQAMSQHAADPVLVTWATSVPTAELEMELGGASQPGTRALRGVLRQLTSSQGERRQFKRRPPILERATTAEQQLVEHLLSRYTRQLTEERRRLLANYSLIDVARRAGNLGRIGQRCFVALFEGRDAQDSLLLQFDEARPSSLEAALGRTRHRHQGQRVVVGRRLLQREPGDLLGWASSTDGMAFHIHRLREARATPEVERLRARPLALLAAQCGTALALGHARSGDPVAIATYLGGSDRADRALAEFASAYADVAEDDHRGLVAAIDDGRLPAAVF